MARSSSDNTAIAPEPAGADIFKALEKLGLQLKKGKVPMEQLTVDHVEKVPQEN